MTGRSELRRKTDKRKTPCRPASSNDSISIYNRTQKSICTYGDRHQRTNQKADCVPEGKGMATDWEGGSTEQSTAYVEQFHKPKDLAVSSLLERCPF